MGPNIGFIKRPPSKKMDTKKILTTIYFFLQVIV